ncbi:hypothetical protein ACX12L_13785 [Alicycliphilus sp. T452]
MPSDLAQREHGSLLDTLRRKVADIEALRAQLAQSRAQLVELMAQANGGAAPPALATKANRRR